MEGIGKDICALNTRSFIVFSCKISPKLPTEGERGGWGMGGDGGGWGGMGVGPIGPSYNPPLNMLMTVVFFSYLGFCP